MAVRFTTGIAGLDAQLGGGVPRGTVHVVLAEPMNAHELMGHHFAAGGTSLGQTVEFFATEASERQVKQGVQAVGGHPEKVEVRHVPPTGELGELPKGARVVLDNLSDVTAAIGFEAAFAELRRAKQTIHSHGDAMFVMATGGLLDPKETMRLRQWADGVMELGFERQGFGLYPFLKLTKMRGVADSYRIVLFKETARGLSMESTKRVF